MFSSHIRLLCNISTLINPNSDDPTAIELYDTDIDDINHYYYQMPNCIFPIIMHVIWIVIAICSIQSPLLVFHCSFRYDISDQI